jgi:hypothetical protein
MSHFVFKDSDFDSKSASIDSVNKNLRNYISAGRLSTTRSESDGNQYLTVYSLSDIMQGAALYKPAEAALSSQDAALTDSFASFITTEGGGDIANVVSSGRGPIMPGNISNVNQEALSYGVGVAFGRIAPTQIDSVAGLSGIDFSPPEFVGVANGKFPEAALTGLEGQAAHFILWNEAAAGFNLLRKAALQFGFTDPFVVSAYRTWLAQSILKQRFIKEGRGHQAAEAGTSKHGLAIAIDFHADFLDANINGKSGVDWLNENAYKYGYVHPAWAKIGGSNPERWHWEYRAHMVGAI